MTASGIGYGKVASWVKSDLGGTHRTVLGTVGWVILCLLVAQRLNPAALARALPAEEAGSARRRPRRLLRGWSGPDRPHATLTPRLVRAALALPPDAKILVALDTTRGAPGEIGPAGIVFAGPTLPVAWAAIPSPWPKGRFRATTLALVEQLAAAFPADRPWVLTVDRGFPSARLFARPRERQAGWTVRLRLSDRVEVAGV
jgi:hypothetical protein